MTPDELLPHAGEMVLLDRIVSWDEAGALCVTNAHLRPGNPLRCGDRLPTICGVEFALQAAAVHGAMRGGKKRRAYVALLRDVDWTVERLDDSTLGQLQVAAHLVGETEGGVIYDLHIGGAAGDTLLTGRAVIAWTQET